MSEAAPISRSIESIRALYLEKKKRSPAYSMPAFARDLGISKSYLSRLFSGERPLTLKQAVRIAIVLELGPSETEELISKVAQESDPGSKVSNVLKTRAERREKNARAVTQLEIDQFKVISSWYHFAIFNLTRTKDFKSDSKWIAGRLGVSRLEVEVALSRLVNLGLLKMSPSGRYTLAKERVYMGNDAKPELALNEYFCQSMDKAKEALKDLRKEAFENRFMSGVSLPVNAAKVRQIKKRLMEIQQELMEPVTASNLTEVYQVNIQFFPLTKVRD